MKKILESILIATIILGLLISGISCGSQAPEDVAKRFIELSISKGSAFAVSDYFTSDPRFRPTLLAAAVNRCEELNKLKGRKIEYTSIEVKDRDGYWDEPIYSLWAIGEMRWETVRTKPFRDFGGFRNGEPITGLASIKGEFKRVSFDFTTFDKKTRQLEVNVEEWEASFYLRRENGKWVTYDFLILSEYVAESLRN